MRQGTTPTHTFKLPCLAEEVFDARVTYDKDKEIILEKKLSDCKAEGFTLSLTLTQEETFKFPEGMVFVQVRVLTNDRRAYTSSRSSFHVFGATNKEVLV